MILTTKVLVQTLTLGVSAGAGWLAAQPATMPGVETVTAWMVAAACAGSASAILFLILDTKERPPERIARRLLQVMVSFVLGATFGLFVGPSIANFTPLDRAGAVYIGGLTGFGLIGLLVSPKTMSALGQWMISILTRKGGGS